MSMPFFLLLEPPAYCDRTDDDGTKDEEHQRDDVNDDDVNDDDDRNGLPPSSRGLVELAAATFANMCASKV